MSLIFLSQSKCLLKCYSNWELELDTAQASLLVLSYYRASSAFQLIMSRLLDKVNSPADIKALTSQELEALAQEIRNEMINVVTSNGGHMASSLGAVELTLALHRVFESPRDKIVWDVGHQAYAHKLITGRKESFSTLRKMGGVSGFPNREESEHDHFGTGHASTSISAALGMAKARDLSGDNYHVLAVIGDGSIGGGMALEAINNASQLGSNIIVILNDNGMSISPSVGSIARLLDKVRFTHNYDRAMARGQQFIRAIPFSSFWYKLAQRLKSGIKGLIMPTRLWEEFGFTYMGPVNGHKIDEVEKALTYARGYNRKPVLLHLITTKGKGYGPAEDDSICFHGLSPSGNKKQSAPSYSKVFADTCLQVMKNDSKVVIITAAMPEGNSLSAIQEAFPERVIDVGICEQHAVTFAAGLATQGYKPVVAIYSTFLQRSFDQIVHDVCLQKLPVTFAIDRAGIVGEDGKTHQGALDLSYLSLIPNMVVSAPKDEGELQDLMYTAINSGRPMAVRYPRGCGYGVALSTNPAFIEIGSSEELKPGKDLTIIATGTTVLPALKAAEMLELNDVDAGVINCRFVKPLDEQLITRAASATGRVLVVEENVLFGGLGSIIAQTLHNTNARLDQLSLGDDFVQHGAPELLRKALQLDSQGIFDQALKLFGADFETEITPLNKQSLSAGP